MQINLLPWRAQARSQHKKEFLQILLCSMLLVLVILWLWYLLLTQQLAQQKNENTLLNKKLVGYAASDQMDAQLTHEQQQLKNDLTLLQQQALHNTQIANFFITLSQCLPTGILLTQIKWENDRIILLGNTTSAAQVNLFAHNLRVLSWLTPPAIQALSATEFSLEVKVHG
jgi:Tfp pilus assembly protein PilN